MLATSPRHVPALRLAREIRENYAETIDPATLLAQGRKAFDEKNFDQAVGFFRKLVVVSPDFPEGKAWLAKAEGPKQLNLAQVKESVRKSRQTKRAKIARSAEDLMLRKEWAMALSQWRKVLSMDSSNSDAARGVSACRDALRTQAEEIFKKGDVGGSLEVYRVLQ